MKTTALTIAGSDPSGGAGIQADLKTFHQFGIYGMAAITLLTIQNTQSVTEVKVLDGDFVLKQVKAVFLDIVPGAVKTGALGSADVIEKIAEASRDWQQPLVVDPVMISKHGKRLLDENAQKTLMEKLLPQAFLVTPNLHEAEILSGQRVKDIHSAEKAAKTISQRGCQAVLIKGGHFFENSLQSTDVLFYHNKFLHFSSPRFSTVHTHGTGCTYSAAITACLASGLPLTDSVQRAKDFISEAIKTAPELGKGQGPVNHHAWGGKP